MGLFNQYQPADEDYRPSAGADTIEPGDRGPADEVSPKLGTDPQALVNWGAQGCPQGTAPGSA